VAERTEGEPDPRPVVIESADLLDQGRQREVTLQVFPDAQPGRDRILRSWLWVDYAELVLPTVFVSWLLGEPVPDLSATNSVAELDVGWFTSVQAKTPRVVEASAGDRDDLDAGLRAAIDRHVGPVLAGASAITRIGLRTMWGSVASAIVTRAPVYAAARGGRIDPRDLEAAIGRRPELAGKGEVVCVEHDGSLRFGFHRSTCCLWFRLEPGRMCEGCVMAPREELIAALRSPEREAVV
jgi:ferric iron reductase protein FhuF